MVGDSTREGNITSCISQSYRRSTCAGLNSETVVVNSIDVECTRTIVALVHICIIEVPDSTTISNRQTYLLVVRESVIGLVEGIVSGCISLNECNILVGITIRRVTSKVTVEVCTPSFLIIPEEPVVTSNSNVL